MAKNKQQFLKILSKILQYDLKMYEFFAELEDILYREYENYYGDNPIVNRAVMLIKNRPKLVNIFTEEEKEFLREAWD